MSHAEWAEPDDTGVAGGIAERSDRYRNVPPDEVSPVDNLIIDAFMPLAEPAVEAGVTPNHLSLVGGALALAAIAFLAAGYTLWFVLLFGLSYVFDALDGWYARSFHLFSPYGEMLDHGKDMLVVVLLALVVVFKLRAKPLLIVAIGLLYFVSLAAEGCTQRAVEERKRLAGVASGSDIDFVAQLCPPGTPPQVARFFAPPSFMVLVAVAIVGVRVFRT
jgi:phosphatidylglycerophosphate synthase